MGLEIAVAQGHTNEQNAPGSDRLTQQITALTQQLVQQRQQLAALTQQSSPLPTTSLSRYRLAPEINQLRLQIAANEAKLANLQAEQHFHHLQNRRALFRYLEQVLTEELITPGSHADINSYFQAPGWPNSHLERLICIEYELPRIERTLARLSSGANSAIDSLTTPLPGY